ncbi:class I SAM-dependent methyltransferase [Nocardioides sp. 616]|uniref:class I SAM-dependent methyltransferase n=1 Tax=Nocardioides sp. 616 TaxID=2268090 RepID=UPI000CE38F92|nr:class I SAM-dependent methyltransferase [Nocardioides sp. 616]
MSSQDVTPVTGGTAPGDYAESYYARVLNGAEGEYTWDNPSWREHSRSLADRLIALANPKTTLDVGCAKGLLVQALAEKGVDARGIDISEHALAGAHPEVRPRLELSSAARPLEGRFDLITCLEVVEHLDPRAARASIDAMCAATDRVLFSSTPHESPEATHVNVRPTSEWAAAFAERGFYRRADVNLDFLTPWAVLFERSELQPRDIVHRYESSLVHLAGELSEKRQGLLALQRELDALHHPDPQAHERAEATAQHVANLELHLESARHDVLTTRDHIIGLEAEAVRLQATVNRLNLRIKAQQERVQKLRDRLRGQQKRLARTEERLKSLKASRAYRVGRLLTGSKSEL